MNKGLVITCGPSDHVRNPGIQGLLDNLDIAKKEYRVHTDGLDMDTILQFVSTYHKYLYDKNVFSFRTF